MKSADRVPIIMNCPCRKGLPFLEALIQAEQEACKTVENLFETLNNKLRLQHYETILSLQYFKINTCNNENAEEWMGRLYLMTVACKYKVMNRCLKEQLIYGLNDDGMIVEIICELTAISNRSLVTSEQVLAWVRRVLNHRGKTTVLDTLKLKRNFDMVQSHRTIHDLSDIQHMGICMGDVEAKPLLDSV